MQTVQLVTGQHTPVGSIAVETALLSSFPFFLPTHSRTAAYAGFSSPQVVWSANRNHPVREKATLQLTGGGDLVLRDVDGTLVWSTDTTGKSVVGLNMTEMGNLVLFDKNNGTVWQSFDHPTDSLVLGQMLVPGQKLKASDSPSNFSDGGLFSLSVTEEGLFAYFEPSPLQAYFESYHGKHQNNTPIVLSYIMFLNGSLAFFDVDSEPNQPSHSISILIASSSQFIRLGSDGHLRAFEWSSEWKQVENLLKLSECDYPLACGDYAICSKEQCKCPTETGYFRLLNEKQPTVGCSEITRLSCAAPEHHRLHNLEGVTHLYNPDKFATTNIENCKQACLNNCSCKVAFFGIESFDGNDSAGDCFLVSNIVTLRYYKEYQKNVYSSLSATFIKIQVPTNAVSQTSPPTDVPSNPLRSQTKTTPTTIILGSSLGAIFGVLMIIISVVLFRKRKVIESDEEDYLDQVPGMPTRFTYEDLKVATKDFGEKLGEGGFGSVFQGTLRDGTKVAVKCLEGIAQVKMSFLAEVETIGSIHHVNLVRLVGFCADKLHRFLVYEYMLNGSLEKWIFDRKDEPLLSWKTRRKIILDVAKGLAYLHEDCRQKILHLDIKPQNILLDESFNAKVSDFGLAKLIDKDQSQVMTTMRGTLGYLAPEWLSAVITEKVDVYSFGVLVLEIVCGRKNLDYSQPEENMHLLGVLKRKAMEERLFDLVDGNCEDMLLNREECMEMMTVAVWCIQSDYTKRPSMSAVVKVLEGAKEIELDLDYNFSSTKKPLEIKDLMETSYGASTPFLPSILSVPRS